MNRSEHSPSPETGRRSSPPSSTVWTRCSTVATLTPQATPVRGASASLAGPLAATGSCRPPATPDRGVCPPQDDDGHGWSLLAHSMDPTRVHPGAMLLAGNHQAQAVVRILAVDGDGQVHFTILPGPVAKNRHLLDRSVA